MYHQSRPKLRAILRRMIVVGGIQSGKSTFCSFIVNENEEKLDSKSAKFEIGDESTEKTKEETCHYVPSGVVNSCLRFLKKKDESPVIPIEFAVVDTSGNNEKLLSCRRKKLDEEFSYAFIIVKYGEIINDIFFKNMSFYRILFSQFLRRKNIALVITNAENTNDWNKKKKKSGSDPYKLIPKYQSVVSEVLGYDSLIPVFPLCCYSKKENVEAWENAQSVKTRILSLVCQESETVTFRRIVNFPKTPENIEKDLIMAEELEGIQDGYSEGMSMGKKNLKIISRDILRKKKRLIRINEEISDIDFFLEEKDTEDRERINHKGTQSIRIKGRSAVFRVGAEFEFWMEIRGNGWIQPDSISIDESFYKEGIILSEEELDVTILAYTWSNIRYEKEIEKKKAAKKEKEREISEINQELDDLVFKENSMELEIRKYKSALTVIGTEINRLRRNYFTSSECPVVEECIPEEGCDSERKPIE